MSHPFLTRMAIVGVAAAATLVLAACGDTARDVSVARSGVARFHQQLDAAKYDEIYIYTVRETMDFHLTRPKAHGAHTRFQFPISRHGRTTSGH